MAVMDEFKEEREALKNGTFKEKISYFWDYYKWYVIGAIILIVAIASFCYEMLTKKDTAFTAVMLNTSELELELQAPQAFADYVGIDTEEYTVEFDTSFRIIEESPDELTVTNTQKLFAYVSAQQVDVMITDDSSFRKYANSDNFYDLREILTAEQLAKYEPYFYYVDWTVVNQINEASMNLNSTYVPDYPDPTKPEEMEQPVPVGIYFENTELMEEYYFRGENTVIGVYLNTPHLDLALQCIDFLYNDSIADTQ